MPGQQQIEGTAMTIRARLAHMGIYVHDREKMERFYTEVLGLMVTDHGEGRGEAHLTFLSGSRGNHHQVVLVTGRPDTSGFNPIQQISFMVDSLADLREVRRRALALGATDMRPVSHGNAWSIYFKDPEGNTVEAYLDTPFHVPQPHGKFLDLSKPDEEILRATEEACRKEPGFMPIGEFQKGLGERLAR
jgi:catechol 2,3-dioxygenase